MKTLRASAPLFVFWLVLTGSFAPTNLVSGVVLSGLLGYWASTRLWPTDDDPSLSLESTARLCLYIPWLLKEIVVAAVGVAEKVLDPRMPIAPVVIVHHTPLRSAIGRVAFANSITLTPGTLTVDLHGSDLTVHCLAEDFAIGIENGDMESRIAKVFEE